MLLVAFWASSIQAQCPYTVEVVQSAPLSCNGGPVTLTPVFNPAGPGYSYTWFGNGAVYNTLNLSITQPGNYFVVVVDSTSFCSTTVLYTAVADSTLTTASIVGSGCGNTVYTAISNDPNSTYQWSNGVTTAQIEPTAVGTYCVTITGSAGCTAQSCQVYSVGNPMSVSVVGWNNNICSDSLGIYAALFLPMEQWQYPKLVIADQFRLLWRDSHRREWLYCFWGLLYRGWSWWLRYHRGDYFCRLQQWLPV